MHANAALYQYRLDEALAHLGIARSYAATAPADRGARLRMAIAALDLLLARLRGDFDAVYERALPSSRARRGSCPVITVSFRPESGCGRICGAVCSGSAQER